MIELEAELRRLPDPVAPATSVAAIMTRVREVDDRNALAAASGAVDEGDLRVARTRIRDLTIAPTWRPWAAAAGAAVVAATYVPALVGGGLAERMLSLRLVGWLDGSVSTSAPLALATAAGLAVYLLAAAPLRERQTDGRK